MKKTFLAIALCAAAISCNMRNTIYNLETFGIVESSSAIMEDSGFLQYPSKESTLSEYAAGTRVHYIFNMPKDDSTHIELCGIEKTTVKEIIPTSQIETDTLGERSVQVARFALYTGGYMNIHFAFSYIPRSTCEEIINMTFDDVENHDDTLVFTLRHKRYIPEEDQSLYQDIKETNTSFAYGIISFPINKEVETAKAKGLKTVPIKIYNMDAQGTSYAIKGIIPTNTYIQKPIRIE